MFCLKFAEVFQISYLSDHLWRAVFRNRARNNFGDEILLINPMTKLYYNGYGFPVLPNGKYSSSKNLIFDII